MTYTECSGFKRLALAYLTFVGLFFLNPSVHGQSCLDTPEWSRDGAYWEEDSVVYKGYLYEAKWWNQNELPGKSEVWDMVMACGDDQSDGGVPCTGIKGWIKDQVYVAGDEAAYQNKRYSAKWWTKGDEPGASDVWLLKGECLTPPDPDPDPDPGPQPPKPWALNVFAPYVDVCAWPTPSISDMMKRSGVESYTLAFIVSDQNSNPSWGGVIALETRHFETEINKVRKMGGNVIVSFGGAAGTELALSNTDVSSLAQKYQSVIDMYQLNWVDFDIEGMAVADKPSIDRRNKAIKRLEENNPDLKVAFCLPTLPSGLTADGIHVLENAISNGVRIDVVNIMAMDYGDSAAPNPDGQMGRYAIEASRNLFKQLQSLYPGRSDDLIWKMVGVTPMIGQNDVPSEIFYLKDAKELVDFAKSKKMSLLSMWSTNRDNGSCGKNSNASPGCSGIVQGEYDFAALFNAYSSESPTPDPPPDPDPTPDPKPTPDPPPTPDPTQQSCEGIEAWNPAKRYVKGSAVYFENRLYKAQKISRARVPGISNRWAFKAICQPEKADPKSPVPCENATLWEENLSYRTGDAVINKEKLFVAIQDIPKSSGQTPGISKSFEYKGICSSLPPLPAPSPTDSCENVEYWNPEKLYKKGDKVYYENKRYSALKKARGRVPGISKRWSAKKDCNPSKPDPVPPVTCESVPPWNAKSAYPIDSRVVHQKKKFKVIKAVPASSSEIPGISKNFQYEGICSDAPIPSEDKRIIGYYPEWGIYDRNYLVSDIPAKKLTHINYAFANLESDGSVVLFDKWAAIEKSFPGELSNLPFKGNFNQLVKLKQENPHLKTLISIGGWTLSKHFSDVAKTDALRKKFAQSAVQFMTQYQFDGVDIDWEYPVTGGLEGNSMSPEDKTNFTLMLAEIRKELDLLEKKKQREYLLTAALSAGIEKVENIEVKKVFSHLDFANIMTYDLFGAWESKTGHHAGLYKSDKNNNGYPLSQYDCHSVISAYIAKGAPSNQVILGVPFYGRAWQGVKENADGLIFVPSGPGVPPGTFPDSSGNTGVNDYFQIAEFEKNAEYQSYFDESAKASYLYSPKKYEGHLISYESLKSLDHKIAYVKNNGLGGIMFWDLSGDVRNNASISLLQRLYESLLSGNNPQPDPPPSPFGTDDLKISYQTVKEDTATFEGRILVENPNASYRWNGSFFDVRNINFAISSEITSLSSENGDIKWGVKDGICSMDLTWQSLFPYSKKVGIIIKGKKSGDRPYPEKFKVSYVRGESIVYPPHAGLPDTWKKSKKNLSINDLIANSSEYYKPNLPAVKDHFVTYNPINSTQISIGQVKSVPYPVNSVNGVRIWIPSKYMAMGLGFVYEFFKINPNYMVALGTKENFAAGMVDASAGNKNNPVLIDGETWYWPIVSHPDGPYQQETGNFIDCQKFFPDYLPASVTHDDLTPITADPLNLNFITSGISSGLSLTVTREQMHAVSTINFSDFLAKAKDPYAEFSILTFSYNRGFGNFLAKKIFTDNREKAIQSLNIAKEFDLSGHASHVETVRAIMDEMNKTTNDLYDAELTWQDMEKFFSKLKLFYQNGTPDEGSWNDMLKDVKQAFDLLKVHWKKESISFRYDFLTILRVTKAYLPKPYNPRPTGEDWYYQIINAVP